MPLLVKDFTWRQTEDTIVIRVPLNGVHSSKVDIISSDNYIKAHFYPFLFEVFLYSSVKESESRCTLADDEIVFELHKSFCGFWDNLESNLSKAEKKEMREINLEKVRKNAHLEQKRKSAKKAELDREAVRQQIALDTQQRKIIEEIKENEKNTAMRQLEEWKATKEAKVTDCTKQNDVSAEKKVVTARKSVSSIEPGPSNRDTEEVKPMPLPRNSGTIQVHFTHRAFPTPKRESQVPEEEEWLKKQAEARRQVGFMAEDLRPEELDPVWLKDKGDSFFKVGNYLGAISAYSHAIQLGSKMPALYSNRAAAHMAIGNLHKAVNDCSTALELLTPCVEKNALSRARCHARRGSALCKLGLMRQGLGELEAAVALQPNDDKLRMDLEKTRALVDSSPHEEELE
ncbi:dynein axonemal assembly factor 4 [Periplaneta americana]|uniref:dynein axonemal assembly factor 4 n=1 Tax=Periplaneta americana TaxID=6978 RepID=UPI0037E753F2